MGKLSSHLRLNSNHDVCDARSVFSWFDICFQYSKPWSLESGLFNCYNLHPLTISTTQRQIFDGVTWGIWTPNMLCLHLQEKILLKRLKWPSLTFEKPSGVHCEHLCISRVQNVINFSKGVTCQNIRGQSGIKGKYKHYNNIVEILNSGSFAHNNF